LHEESELQNPKMSIGLVPIFRDHATILQFTVFHGLSRFALEGSATGSRRRPGGEWSRLLLGRLVEGWEGFVNVDWGRDWSGRMARPLV
jgi:hypothetical protein